MRWLLASSLLFVAVIASAAASFMLIINGVSANASYVWPGGIGAFKASASAWNSASVSLQVLGPDGSTWITAGTNTTCAANCAGIFYLDAGQIRAVVSGGTPTALYASAAQVQSP